MPGDGLRAGRWTIAFLILAALLSALRSEPPLQTTPRPFNTPESEQAEPGKDVASVSPIAEIALEGEGSVATVVAEVVSVDAFSAGVKLQLYDGTGSVTLLLWQEMVDALDDCRALEKGTVLRAQGEVQAYEGNLEIVPWIPSDVMVLEAAGQTAEDLALGQLSREQVGRVARVDGLLRSLRTSSAGMKGTLDDGTGTVSLWIWQSLYDRLEDPTAFVVGAHVSVEGLVNEYQGELEIVPLVASDVRVTGIEEVAAAAPTVTSEPSPATLPALVASPSTTFEGTSLPSGLRMPSTLPPFATPEPTDAATPAPTAPSMATPRPTVGSEPRAEVRTIGQIVWNDIGRTFTIKAATITDVWWTSGGASCRLSDGQNTIIMFMFQDDYEWLSLDLRYGLVQDAVLTVTGEISEWSGDLEIIPDNQADIQVISTPLRPPLERRSIADISPSDEGRWFIIEAEVREVRPFSKGTNLLVDDMTGQITVLLWQNVYERVPNRDRLAPGAVIRVVGQFDIWAEGGNVFEIVPRTGVDVDLKE